MNPFDGLASFCSDLIKIHKADQWAKLVFTLLFSGIVTFLFVSGSSLAAHRPAAEAVGTGMLMAAVVCTKLYRSSDLTKGTTVVLPQAEAAVLNPSISVFDPTMSDGKSHN